MRNCEIIVRENREVINITERITIIETTEMNNNERTRVTKGGRNGDIT